MEKQIVHEIAQRILSDKERSNYGLLTGYIGHMIFLSEYSKIQPEYSKAINGYIDRFYSDIEQEIISPSYSRGISGACLGIGYLHLNNKKPFAFVSKSIDEYLAAEAEEYLSSQNFDFLHGAIGIGFYFIERAKEGNKIAIKALKSILENLDKNKISDGKGGVTFLNFNKVSDISLSHGLSAILLFLCKLIEIGFSYKNLAHDLSICIVNYILSQKIDRQIYGSQFPYTSLEDSTKGSRLAWCYGDLGICIALLKASEIQMNRELNQHATEILLYNTQRRDLHKNLVQDSEICHGTSGISLIYHILNQKYKIPELAECEKFWLDKTIELYHKKDSHNNLSLLDGLSGTGLVLLNSFYHTGTRWSHFFLI
ncbi:lanthionine synthetase LanC family protein [Chryseobacterium contaminans]|uniref:lanthionine synthetase LanC family protein n=1 Tax=Chryseobacterium contaminans TaxID=1423959 RepID=UPI003017C42E